MVWLGKAVVNLALMTYIISLLWSSKTPPYRRQDITQPVTVYMQLRRTSDGETSDPTPFQYTPENLGTS